MFFASWFEIAAVAEVVEPAEQQMSECFQPAWAEVATVAAVEAVVATQFGTGCVLS